VHILTISEHCAGAMVTLILALCASASVFTIEDVSLLLRTGHPSVESQQLTANGVPKLPLLLFDLTATLTLVLSTMAHTFSCMPRRISIIFWRLDQIGIGLGIFGCFIPGTFYMFYCYPDGTGLRYLLVTSVLVGTCAAVNVIVNSCISQQALKLLRLASYFLLSASAVAPLSELMLHQSGSCALRQAVLGTLACAGFALVGGLFYGATFPEKWLPGRFDLFGSSHQIFHVFVTLCLVCYHLLFLRLWQWRSRADTCTDASAAALCLWQG
jgi:adiponectin receptor